MIKKTESVTRKLLIDQPFFKRGFNACISGIDYDPGTVSEENEALYLAGWNMGDKQLPYRGASIKQIDMIGKYSFELPEEYRNIFPEHSSWWTPLDRLSNYLRWQRPWGI